MIRWIIEKSVANRLLVLMVAGLLAVLGGWALATTPVDAIPDLSDVQVILYTDYPGQAPQVVEDEVTYPLTTAMLSVPGSSAVRGYSFFGFSLVYVIFEDGTDLYWARSRVLEYLSTAQARLPEGVTPQLGPDATGVGWVYEYTLTSQRHDLSQLRSIQDWYLRYDLTSLPGVAEVASLGGFVRQYQVEVDPDKLRAFRVSLATIKKAIARSNSSVGGRLLEMAETEYMVRGKGYFRSVDDLRNVPVGIEQETHTPILLSQVAYVHLGPEIRRGLADLNGRGEVVTGIVIIRFGQNVLQVIERIKQRLEELKAGLPAGVEIHTAYDRSGLIHRAIDTMKKKLLEEMVVVALVCLIFLIHLRSAFVSIISLPLAVLMAFLVMRWMGQSANIMSLGGIAIAIGVMVDAAVVMVENLHKHREREPDLSQTELVLRASREVGPALFFSLVIVALSFLPVFSLQRQEGRLFTPLAYTKTFSMAAAALLAVTLIPVLMVYLVRGRILPERKNPVNRALIAAYRPVIHLVLRHPLIIISISLVVLAATAFPFFKLGSEFMPPLDEGDLLYMPTTTPGISITKAKELLQQTDRIIASHPMVASVLGKAGRAETATDPAPLSMFETTIQLKDPRSWPRGKTIEDIIRELDAMVRFPGLTNAWTMPIKTRTDMLATGIKTPLGLKLLGPDLSKLSDVGQQVEAVLRQLPGSLSVYAERVVGGNYVDISIHRREAARFGLTVGDVQDVIKSALGGMNVTSTVEGLARYPVNVRFPRDLRDDLDKIRGVPIATPMGHTVPLAQVADLQIVKGPPSIKSENARLTAWIFVDLTTSDVGGFVDRARRAVAQQVKLPPGVSLIWSGQYEYMERTRRRLSLIVPLTIGIIFLLLFVHFRNLIEASLVMLTLPFALVGGVWLMFLGGYNLSVAADVGFIALAGLAASTGVVMLVYLDEAYTRRREEGRLLTRSDLDAAIIEGAVDRVRPKLMTVLTALLGLLPVMIGTETGTRVIKRIAAPMVGGLISSTILTLIIIPAVYLIWRGRRWRKEKG